MAAPVPPQRGTLHQWFRMGKPKAGLVEHQGPRQGQEHRRADEVVLLNGEVDSSPRKSAIHRSLAEGVCSFLPGSRPFVGGAGPQENRGGLEPAEGADAGDFDPSTSLSDASPDSGCLAHQDGGRAQDRGEHSECTGDAHCCTIHHREVHTRTRGTHLGLRARARIHTQNHARDGLVTRPSTMLAGNQP